MTQLNIFWQCLGPFLAPFEPLFGSIVADICYSRDGHWPSNSYEQDLSLSLGVLMSLEPLEKVPIVVF